jgi:Cof subfamily protein (haloacid dehalogenase superfamily)
MIKLLAIDIDGTLLDSRGVMPDAHRDVLIEASARGLEIALVTGRSFHFSLPIANALPVPLTLIVNNGALVKDRDGTTKLQRLLPRAAARLVLDATPGYEDSVALVFDRRDCGEIVCDRMDWTHPNRSRYFEKNKQFIGAASPLAAALTEDPIQVMFNGGVASMRDLAATLRTCPIAHLFSVSQTEYEHRNFSMVDITAAGCSKGSTLEQWVRERGLVAHDVLAAGDNLNDVEMLDYAGTAVVMGNAGGQVKAVPGAHITDSNDEGGLARAIRDLAFSNGRS